MAQSPTFTFESSTDTAKAAYKKEIERIDDKIIALQTALVGEYAFGLSAVSLKK